MLSEFVGLVCTLQHRVFLRQGGLHIIPPALWSECVGSTVAYVTREEDDDENEDVVSSETISLPELAKVLCLCLCLLPRFINTLVFLF